MKKTILSLAIISLFVGGILTSCNSSADKVDNAEQKVENAQEILEDANFELNQAKRDSIQQWKEETLLKINDNDKSILELKSKISGLKKDAKLKYEENIALIEQKNADLKKKFDDFKDDGQDDWQDFKIEFNRDMDELKEALKNLSVNNIK